MSEDPLLYFNGIRVDGSYDLPPMTQTQLAQVISNQKVSGELVKELRERFATPTGAAPLTRAQLEAAISAVAQQSTDFAEELKARLHLHGPGTPEVTREGLQIVLEDLVEEFAEAEIIDELEQRFGKKPHYRVMEGVNPNNLAEAGWGVIFAAKDPQADAVREALGELLDLRRQQAQGLYKEYTDADGYRPRESKNAFLERHGVGPGAVRPESMPYYLLIVGSPEAIPYRFQNQLDVQHAVGRIHFDTLDEYRRYAHSVVQAETGDRLDPVAAFFGVRNEGDRATEFSADKLVAPLSDKLRAEWPDWKINTWLGDDATKARLGRLLGGAEAPALLFTASHGVGFPNGHERQHTDQGALLCQDWPGPGSGELRPAYYFAGRDVPDEVDLLGRMAFFFACYGAGTPKEDDFTSKALKTRAQIAPRAFLSYLPRRLLSHGMQAVVGHVERAWGYSFMWGGADAQWSTFESAFRALMDGATVGYAMEYFNERYAELAADLTRMMEDLHFSPSPQKQREITGQWTAHNDARGYIVIGDPAARLPLKEEARAEPRPEAVRPIPVPQEGSRSEGFVESPIEYGRVGDWLNGILGHDTAPQDETVNDMNAVSPAPEAGLRSLSDVINKLAEALSAAVADLSSLEIATYTSDALEGVTYDAKSKTLEGKLRLRAMTHISFDGDIKACLPEKDGKVDRELWQVHLEMVKEAQTNRAELLRAVMELLKR